MCSPRLRLDTASEHPTPFDSALRGRSTGSPRRALVTMVVAVAVLAAPAVHGSSEKTSRIDPRLQWSQWRGPLATGEAPRANPPVVWSESQNVHFKVPLPGLGHSTPVVWGDRLYLTAAVPHGETQPAPAERDPGAHDNFAADRRMRFVVMAIDRHDGSVAWQTTVRDAQPHEGTHTTGSWASASPITDGERIYAFFGSQGLHALDKDGKVLWRKDFGTMQSRHGHGEGSSPALWEDTLVVNWDHQGSSFLAALDSATGEERWRVARDEMTSWATPLVVEHGGRAQVIVAATGKIRGYDLRTGAEIWSCGGLSRNVVATPVAKDGVVYVGNSYDWQALLAIRLDKAKGDVTGTDALVWTVDRIAPYVPSAVLAGDDLCFLRHLQGIFTCLDTADGTPRLGPVRLPGMRMIFASPILADGRIYVVGREGATTVLAHGETLDLLATNRLDDTFSASPIAVGTTLYLRGEKHLYALAEGEAKP